MTWSDFIRSIESWVHNHNQHWDRTRYLATLTINCSFGNKKRISPKDLFKLPHDNADERKTPLPTHEEIKSIIGKAVKLPI